MIRIGIGMMICVLLLGFSLQAQQGSIKGKVIDSKTGNNIEYANIVLLNVKDSSLVNGTISSASGSYVIDKIPIGAFLVRVSFIGYETQYLNSVNITTENPVVQMKDIILSAGAHTLTGVEVTEERSLVEYKLDKRVVNVAKDLVAAGGTATEVLETIPSIALDNDGNITLRGSSSVKILVNGRPAELLGSDLQAVLDQIPANTIQNVEIITNPSAKYNPEGASGVINIILKEKNTSRGLSGTVGLDAGSALPKFAPTASGSVNLNYSTKKWLVYGSVDGSLRTRMSDGFSKIQWFKPTTDTMYSNIYQTDENRREFWNGSIRIGSEYSFNQYNSLNLSYQYRNNSRFGYSTTQSIDSLSDNSGYNQRNDYDEHYNNHNVNLNYKKTFTEKERELTLDVSFSANSGKDLSTMEYNGVSRDTHSIRESNAPETRYYTSVFLNYIHPFTDKTKIEAGYNGSFNKFDNDNRFYILANGMQYFDSITSNHYLFSENVNALYATLGHQFTKSLSSQLGLRYEHVSNKGDVNAVPFGVDPYGSLFPTLHVSYTIDSSQSIQFSYSRRVRRPSMWNMNPYRDISNPERIRFGNPNLKPQYTNSLEVSYNKNFKRTNIFGSLYFRETSKMISNYTFPWTEANAEKYGFEWDGDTTQQRIASTWMNIQQSLNAGMEIIVDYKVNNWWKINVSANLYQSNLKGGQQENNQTRSAFLWNAKFNSNFTLPKYWTIQFTARYNAPWLNLQGKMFEVYWADLALKKEIMNRKGTISIRVNDIFATLGYRFESKADNYYNYNERSRLSPYVSAGFTYKINSGNKTRPNKNRNNTMDDSNGGIEDF